MIKLTEVVISGGQYNPEKKGMDSQYRLRNFYVNPKFIVSMIDNEKLNNIHKIQPIMNDLLTETKFTRLTVASGAHGVAHYDITGTPEQHLEKF